jgi:hypothetical protein
MALKIALEDIGPEQGLDPEAVHKLAGRERFESLFIEGPEAAWGELCRLLTGSNFVKRSVNKLWAGMSLKRLAYFTCGGLRCDNVECC